MLRVGVIVNPIAGIGGPAALKGSDGTEVQREALARGSAPRASIRMREALAPLQSRAAELRFATWDGPMGADALAGLGFHVEILGAAARSPTRASDTRAAATVLAQHVDVLMFAGGDGTARDLAEVLPKELVVIGVPAGVKMHSGVFTVTPRDAAALVALLLDGELVAVDTAEVRDIDEAALRQGRVATRYFGELTVPRVGGFLQHLKSSGREVEELVLAEIAESIAERAAVHRGTLILGPGSSVAAVKRRLGIEPTLLGFDLLLESQLVIHDPDATALATHADANTVVVLSFTRGQGFLIGRGNQQLTPEVLRTIPRENVWVVASRTKVLSLEGRPLLVDSGATDVDARLRGLITIVSGYQDSLLYRVGG